MNIRLYRTDKGGNKRPNEYYQEIQVSHAPFQQPPPIIMSRSLGHQPEQYVCPYCHQPIITRIKKSNGAVVWLVSIGFCFLGLVLGCCLIPFFIDDIKV